MIKDGIYLRRLLISDFDLLNLSYLIITVMEVSSWLVSKLV